MQIMEMRLSDANEALVMWRGIEGIGNDPDCDSEAGIARYLERNPGLSFVARDGEQLIGAVLCGHDGRRGYLHHLAVVKEYRKSGIGKELVKRCLAALAENGIPKCNIFLFTDNELGKRFWQHTGWNLREDLAVLQKFTDQ